MEKYLPLGSIVLLNEGSKKIMIYGRRQIMLSTGKVFDYIACLYPEGNINPEQAYLFNHEDIRELVHTGFADKEDREFVDLLKKVDAE